MNINKYDFKILYNHTKNFNLNDYQNLIGMIENNTLNNSNINNVINNNSKDEVINVLNKLNRHSLNKVGGGEKNNNFIDSIRNFLFTPLHI